MSRDDKGGEDWVNRAPRPRSRGEIQRIHRQAQDQAADQRAEPVNRAADADLEQGVRDILGYSVSEVQEAFNRGAPPPPDLSKEIAKISSDIRKGKTGRAKRRAGRVKVQVRREMKKRKGCLSVLVLFVLLGAALAYGAGWGVYQAVAAVVSR